MARLIGALRNPRGLATVRNFLRVLGCIYAIAFVSYGSQAMGLNGSRGILPAAEYLSAAREAAGASAFWEVPSLLWLNSSDRALQALWILGAICALAAIAGVRQRTALTACLVLWLSICAVGQDFLSFQWDVLLLEAGFLAVFADASPIRVWLFRWLIFRLMFFSGAVKLLSGDAAWRDLTALHYHYETQPLPTPLAWYMYQLPLWFQKISTLFVFFGELLTPFLFFAPRRWRHAGAWITIALQLLILLTGNYTFFNFLTIALCMFLFIDPGRVAAHAGGAAGPAAGSAAPAVGLTGPAVGPAGPATESAGPAADSAGPASPVAAPAAHSTAPANPIAASVAHPPAGPARVVSIALAVFIGSISGLLFLELFSSPLPPGGSLVLGLVAPFRIVNSYGLFAVMTTTRPEIIVEGSNDGVAWSAYEFRYKPGDVMRAPPVVAPHQPRLDWQMWFAALGNYRQNRWFVKFMLRLLEGEPSVLGLLRYNPFPAAPPRYVRAEVYLYHFTQVHSQPTGQGERAWWTREPRGIYFPAVSLK